MKKVNYIIIVLLIFLFNARFYAASISGRATFKNGKPVYKLKVICESTYSTYVTYTDKNGMFKFILSDELYTYYYIFISLPGGRRVKIGKRPVHGTNETIDIKLVVNSLKELE